MSDATWDDLRAYAEEQGDDFDALVEAATQVLRDQRRPVHWDAFSDATVLRMVADELGFDDEEQGD